MNAMAVPNPTQMSKPNKYIVKPKNEIRPNLGIRGAEGARRGAWGGARPPGGARTALGHRHRRRRGARGGRPPGGPGTPRKTIQSPTDYTKLQKDYTKT